MPKTIWKFPFQIIDGFQLEMPKGSHIVLVEPQEEQPCIWAEVDSEAPMELRTFLLFGTGHAVVNSDFASHVASFQQPPFVWHLYEASLVPL